MVRTEGALEDLCRRLRAAGRFAVDTEFHRERTYRPCLYLVQVATAEEAAVVDPLAVPDLDPLAALLADASVEKVMQAAENDVEVFYRTLGVMCVSVHDTQVAASLVGLGYQTGLVRLLEQVLGVHLEKGETLADWSHRPLTPRMLEYALEDVRHLLPLFHALEAELERRGRRPWYEAELGALAAERSYEPSADELLLRVRGGHRLAPSELAILRELCLWREEVAAAADVPRQAIAPDMALVALSRAAPEHLEELHRVRGLSPRTIREHGQGLLRALDRGDACPPDRYPAPIPAQVTDPAMASAMDLLGAFVRLHADRSGIAPELLLASRDREALLRSRPDSREALAAASALHGWRDEAVGEPLWRFLRGEVALALGPLGVVCFERPAGSAGVSPLSRGECHVPPWTATPRPPTAT